ncbi:unnamed protein product [Ranitomeya imitator]|uniref:Uncharacterized protein n=1 Tax=Ranitomeya imitator TaxID=111125 RepID=A0ABN9LDM3_9NEOB|nr:unnamed protein product [Ranitomeya imitator]
MLMMNASTRWCLNLVGKT